jgi:hypothetical protein
MRAKERPTGSLTSYFHAEAAVPGWATPATRAALILPAIADRDRANANALADMATGATTLSSRQRGELARTQCGR